MNTAATIFVGMDISKGYADLQAINRARSVLAKTRIDDTPTGHEILRTQLGDWLARDQETTILVGVESSGGLERNWLHMLRRFDPRVTVASLNPLVVKRFLTQDLHRSVTDAHSAAGIARYMAEGMRLHQRQEDVFPDGMQEMYRCVGAANQRLTEVKNQLQSLLPRVHPDLVQFTRGGFAGWVLDLLARYPTAATLARARVSTVAQIPHITEKRAQTVIAAAKQSVAAQTDIHTGVAVTFMVKEIRRQVQAIADLKAALITALDDDPAVRVLTSIPGIGPWTAVSLRMEIGRIERFPSAEALTAYAGLDPRIHESGDTHRRMRISKCGRRRIRAVLYMAALAAVRSNPVISAFYQRLHNTGKPGLVCLTACMRKLLHLAYACWVSSRPFDPAYEKKRQAARIKNSTHDSPSREEVPQQTAPTKESITVTAPVTRREAQRRKAATVPQTRITRVMRGPGAASRQ